MIAVLAPSGGSGSSTVAANLGIVLAEKHRECGLVDLRLSAGDLASMLDLRPTAHAGRPLRPSGAAGPEHVRAVLVRHAQRGLAAGRARPSMPTSRGSRARECGGRWPWRGCGFPTS